MSKKLKNSDHKENEKCYNEQADTSVSAKFFNNLIWMTTSEAAAYLRISANALRTAVCRGQIKARKFRSRLYFNRLEIDNLIETS